MPVLSVIIKVHIKYINKRKSQPWFHFLVCCWESCLVQWSMRPLWWGYVALFAGSWAFVGVCLRCTLQCTLLVFFFCQTICKIWSHSTRYWTSPIGVFCYVGSKCYQHTMMEMAFVSGKCYILLCYRRVWLWREGLQLPFPWAITPERGWLWPSWHLKTSTVLC